MAARCIIRSNTAKGQVYSRLERALMDSTDLFLFESAFARDTYQRTIGIPKGLGALRVQRRHRRRVRSGAPAADATDVVYVGEFRHIKGADLLIDAVARLRADGKPVTLTLAGDGEELEHLKAQVQRSGSARPSASSAMSRRATVFPRAGCWSCPRAAIRCPMS